MAEHGHFYWNELMTRDVERAKTFFGKTVGWTFEEMRIEGNPPYTVIRDGEKTVGGIFDINGERFEGVPENWMSYIAVDDVDKRVEMAKQTGGTVMQEPFDVRGIGRIAIVADPGGAVLGWMTPAPM